MKAGKLKIVQKSAEKLMEIFWIKKISFRTNGNGVLELITAWKINHSNMK